MSWASSLMSCVDILRGAPQESCTWAGRPEGHFPTPQNLHHASHLAEGVWGVGKHYAYSDQSLCAAGSELITNTPFLIVIPETSWSLAPLRTHAHIGHPHTLKRHWHIQSILDANSGVSQTFFSPHGSSRDPGSWGENPFLLEYSQLVSFGLKTLCYQDLVVLSQCYLMHWFLCLSPE